MLSLCVCVRGRKTEGVDTFIQLFKHTHNPTTVPRRDGSPRSSPPDAALSVLSPPAPPPLCRPGRTRAPGEETDFICFDHQPCSLTIQSRSLSHLHPPPPPPTPAPGSPPRPPPRGEGAQRPPELRSGAGARAVLSTTGHRVGAGLHQSEEGIGPGGSGTGADTRSAPLFFKMPPSHPDHRLIPRPGGGGGRTSCCERTW